MALPPLPPRFVLYAMTLLALTVVTILALPDAIAWGLQSLLSAIP